MNISNNELYKVMSRTYGELIKFAVTDEFQNMLKMMGSLPQEERPTFVRNVIMNKNERAKLGINVPKGILIQRSSFGDRRPTLFCIKKYLPKKFHLYWENCNITYDNEFIESDIQRDESAWRKPLPIEVQEVLLSQNLSEEVLLEKHLVN